MDYDRFSSRRYGADGCFDPNHDANAGLPEGVWCHDCLLRGLYETKYSFVSRADFWIAAANAVIRQTSVNNVLDLRNTFKWGRRDTSNCPGSGDRVPSPNGCDDVEGTFIGRMGMEWKDAGEREIMMLLCYFMILFLKDVEKECLYMSCGMHIILF